MVRNNKSRQSKQSKQGPPLQFRPGVELERLVGSFASEHGLQPNEACKCLIALAITSMDVRYYALMNQLAETMGGANAFVRACLHVRTSLDGAVLAMGRSLLLEPERSLFILRVVRELLTAKGLEVQTEGLWFLPQEEMAQPQAEEPQTKVEDTQPRAKTSTARRRRKVRKIDVTELDKPQGQRA